SVFPDSESRRRRNHGPPTSGIPNRKKTRMHTRLSCKIDYLLRSNHRDRSIASEFFTDDSLRKPPGGIRRFLPRQRFLSFVRPMISRLRRVILPNPLRLPASLLGALGSCS